MLVRITNLTRTNNDNITELKINIMNYIKNLINNEIANLGADDKYWGTSENVENENKIFEFFIDNNIVTQEWFDERLKLTNEERLEELYQLV